MAAAGSEHCPYCDGEVAPEGAVPFGAAECASCGRAVWFVTIDGAVAFFRYADARLVLKLLEAIPEDQRLPEKLGLDRVDVLELVAEFRAALEEAAR